MVLKDAKEHASLLGHAKWQFGYFTFRARRIHERRAEKTRRNVRRWANVAKMLRTAEAQARMAKLVALLDERAPRI
ncbi:hypothetical protein N0V84_006736 [Fusarium piperis]|uniref:Uncharacterized protein n=1 Tax=Fusarium piperis TaxID=1435070 RepID=A0A9W8WB94_9HYPO|nr:hypothetical protein N0V84_006736 [Fusarium piperis]